MIKLPSLSSKELIKALRSAGFENAPKRGKESHIALVKKEAGRTLLVIVPQKKIIQKGTLNGFFCSSRFKS